MKKIVSSLLFFFVCFVGFSQNQNETVCRPGFTFEISQSAHWGKNKPVVTHVIPSTAAYQAGLKAGDIIVSIYDIPVEDIPLSRINEFLNAQGKNEIIMTVSNLEAENRKIMFRKACKRANAVTEDFLAGAFSLYSPEANFDRIFTCPFTTTTTLEPVDFMTFKTYAFSTIYVEDNDLEKFINETISTSLSRKGLKEGPVTPDLLVQTYYFFDRNPNFKGKNQLLVRKTPVYRFDRTRNEMVVVPFLNGNSSDVEAEYILQFGIRLVDQKIHPGRIVWECEANELLEEPFTLEEYTRIHIPLMCMQYPYVKYSGNVLYRVDRKVYNYTGIEYDINRMGLVLSADRNTPAYTGGIRPRDVIMRINGQPLNASAEMLSENYNEFIANTEHLRDEHTTYTHANGYKNCMLWDKNGYVQLTDYFQDKSSQCPFAYLFYYIPYINPSGINTCTFELRRGNKLMEVKVNPSIRTEQSVYIP